MVGMVGRARRRGKDHCPKGLLIPVALLLLAGIIMNISVVHGQAEPRERYFRIKARQWVYSPSVIEVNQGDTVIIELSSEDVSHGIYIEGYDLRADLILGEGMPGTVTLKFKADKPGAFTFRCTVFCGPFHPFMTGKLVVNPNYTLNGGMVLSFVIAALAVVLFYRRW